MSTSTTSAGRELEPATTAFLSGKLAQVDINGIKKELQELWRSASESGDGHLVTRACALNLILYSEDQNAELQAGDILDEIAIRHPCRAILAINRESENKKLEAWVSARCHLTDSKTRKQICCEQITVLSEGNGPHELASVVLPLVISDLPVHMWWHTRGLSSQRIQPFLGSIDELIIDSARDGDGNSILSELHYLLAGLKSKRLAVVSDLNWRRTYVFREALALAFSQSEGNIPPDCFKSISRVRIKYAGAGDGKDQTGASVLNQSLLYLGWLASRLGWQAEQAQAKSDGLVEIAFSQERAKKNPRVNQDAQASPGLSAKAGSAASTPALRNAPGPKTGEAPALAEESPHPAIALKVQAEVSQLENKNSCPGQLCSITVEFADKTVPSIYVSHPKNVPTVQVRYSMNATDTWMDLRAENEAAHFSLSQMSEARMIDDELETADPDPAFEPALAEAVSILEMLRGKA